MLNGVTVGSDITTLLDLCYAGRRSDMMAAPDADRHVSARNSLEAAGASSIWCAARSLF
jgi:hypothetical protein